jgi:succinoglycan biosynthesis transport protein ExoP
MADGMAFARDAGAATLTSEVSDEQYGRARRRVFVLTTLAFVLAGVLYTALQPAVYESTATVLMSAPTAIDEQMLEADRQGVAIQRRTLTGSEITRILAESFSGSYGIDITPIELRQLLDVRPVPETNLLELAALGSDSEILPPLVESWIEVYTSVRARDIEDRKSQTLTEVENELSGLNERLIAARDALDSYRQENEIISMDRQQNAVLSQLDGLNSALNVAVETEITSKSYLETLRISLAAGERVVPEDERSEVAAMATELSRLRAALSELRARYTDDYIRKDPRLRELPERMEILQVALADAYEEGGRLELANAERTYAAARESVADIQRRLDAHKQSVSDFNTMYAKHEALVGDLARLEELNRDTQARQVQIEVSQVEKYPQVSVIDWPAPDAQTVGPNYVVLLGGTFSIAILAGIFAVWLYSFLHPRSAQPAFVTLSGVHMYPQDGSQALEQLTPRTERLDSQQASLIADQSVDDEPAPRSE